MNIVWLLLPRLDHHRKAFGCRRSFVFFPRSDVFELDGDLAGFQSLEGPDFSAGSTHTEVLEGISFLRLPPLTRARRPPKTSLLALHHRDI